MVALLFVSLRAVSGDRHGGDGEREGTEVVVEKADRQVRREEGLRAGREASSWEAGQVGRSAGRDGGTGVAGRLEGRLGGSQAGTAGMVGRHRHDDDVRHHDGRHGQARQARSSWSARQAS